MLRRTLWSVLLWIAAVVSPLPAQARQTPAWSPPVAPMHRQEDPPALELTIEDDVPAGTMAGAGDEVHYTLVFTNVGGASITNVRLAAVIPAYTQVLSQTVTTWSCHTANEASALQSCTLAVGSLAAGTSHTAELGLVLDNPLPPSMTMVTLDATVTGDEVVCGECGLASIDTPVDPRSDAQGDAYRIYCPTVSRPG